MAEHLPSLQETLGSVPNTTKESKIPIPGMKLKGLWRWRQEGQEGRSSRPFGSRVSSKRVSVEETRIAHHTGLLFSKKGNE